MKAQAKLAFDRNGATMTGVEGAHARRRGEKQHGKEMRRGREMEGGVGCLGIRWRFQLRWLEGVGEVRGWSGLGRSYVR